MNVTDYTYLINKPDAINEKQTNTLEKVLDEFPYFQSARALRLKGLYNQNSFKYNHALKVTAAHTTDRTILFDFITSNDFVAIQKHIYDEKKSKLLEISVADYEIIKHDNKPATTTSFVENPIITLTEEGSEINKNKEYIVEKLNVGKPLDFSVNEKHSFQEWLQLSTTRSIIRENNDTQNADALSINKKKKKAELIDKFIESNPKIPPVKTGAESNVLPKTNKIDTSYLMTETLARVYLEQKKYQKAIQAYEILILKYPEKSSFFANHISGIKILQQNNK